MISALIYMRLYEARLARMLLKKMVLQAEIRDGIIANSTPTTSTLYVLPNLFMQSDFPYRWSSRSGNNFAESLSPS